MAVEPIRPCGAGRRHGSGLGGARTKSSQDQPHWTHAGCAHVVSLLLLLCGNAASAAFSPFSYQHRDVQLSESAPVGMAITVYTNVADDLTYEFVPNYHSPLPFRLVHNDSLQLVVTEQLDRELVSRYDINISATDRSGQKGYLSLMLDILDVNDNSPIFDHSDYSVSINESLGKGMPILQVRATDIDEEGNPNSAISYYILANEYFLIDENSGVISTKQDGPIDCGLKKVCVFTVFAHDRGLPRQNGRAYVTVNLLDSNTHDPAIKFRFFSLSENAQVDENALNGSVVAAVLVEDPDHGLNGQTSLAIVGGNEAGHFRLESTGSSPIIRVNGTLNRERISRYNLTIEATDFGSPARSSRAWLAIYVNGANNHEPIFSKQIYEATLLESAPVGSFVASITAVDLDEGINADLYYSLSGPNAFYFHIDPTSGTVSTKLGFDYGQINHFELRVTARDGGPNPKWAHATLLVRLEKDNAPILCPGLHNATIVEEIDEPLFVTQLNVTVRDHHHHRHDDGGEPPLRFQIVGQEPSEGPFRIDERYGTIWTTAKLDREKTAEFNLLVAVEDESGFSTTCRVAVVVEDRNDNPPRFTRLFTANITEDAEVGSLVVQVTSSDKDSPPYAEASYSFIGSAEAFEIEPSTGKVFLIKELDRETKEEYHLMVAANDSSWRAQTTLTINVIDVNDNAPRFSQALYEFERPLTSLQEFVGQVSATDSDKGRNGQIEYSLRNGTEFFAINARTGELTIKQPLLSNKLSHNELAFHGQHYLLVSATDLGQVPLSGQALVRITLVPEEDQANSQSKAVRIPIPTNLKNGSIVFNLRSEMSWRALEEDSDRLLYVMGTKIVFLGEGVVERGSVYHYEFRSVNDELNFTIALVIVSPNVFAPKFTQPRQQIVVPENQQSSEALMQIIASDGDPDVFNKDLLYSYRVLEYKWNDKALAYYSEMLGYEWTAATSFTGGGRAKAKLGIEDLISHMNRTESRRLLDPFRIDRNRGTLYLTSPLDFELIVMYRLEVTARDQAWFDTKNTTTYVTVICTDVNDNRPIFSNMVDLQRGMEVFENNPIGHIVGEVHAIDFDSPPNSLITYEIDPVFDYHNFSISARTGQIQALISFDYERQSEYSIQVCAKNNNEMKRSILIKVKVKDINEFEGRFADPMSVGVLVVILFFIVLLVVITTSFVIFRSQKKKNKDMRGSLNNNHRKISTLPLSIPPIKQHHHYHMAPPGSQTTGPSPPSTLMGHHVHPQSLRDQSSLHHPVPPLPPPTAPPPIQHVMPPPPMKPHRPPDVVDQNPMGATGPPNHLQRVPPAPPSAQFSLLTSPSDYSEIMQDRLGAGGEHYEENSSVAPSDFDSGLVYHHYHKGFPPSSRLDSSSAQHRHVPLARLSPSVSELTAPRILTLHDLSPSGGQMPKPPAERHHLHHHGKRSEGPSRTSAQAASDSDDANTVDSFTSSEFDESHYHYLK